jgi:hypothetical protein
MSFLPAGMATEIIEDPFADPVEAPAPVAPGPAAFIPALPPRPNPFVPAHQSPAPNAPPAHHDEDLNKTFTVTLKLGVRDIPKLDAFSLSDPCVAMFDATTGVELGRTETIWNVKSADFQTELKVVYSPAHNTKFLKFTVVDTVWIHILAQ